MIQPATGTPLPPWGAGPYSIQRHGTTLATCDSEPVRTPGCIQAHGALLVLRLPGLQIIQASDNTLQHLGEDAGLLLGQPISQVVGTAQAAHLGDMLARGALDRGGLRTWPRRGSAGRGP